jgi:hypothetical protein
MRFEKKMKHPSLLNIVGLFVLVTLVVPIGAGAGDKPRLSIEMPSEGQTIQPLPGLGPVVVIKFRTDDFKIESVDKGHGSMTDMATQEKFKSGHIHVTVDDNSWYFVHSDNDPIVIAGLSPGKHSVKLQLAGPNHMPIGTAQTVNFTMVDGRDR